MALIQMTASRLLLLWIDSFDKMRTLGRQALARCEQRWAAELTDPDPLPRTRSTLPVGNDAGNVPAPVATRVRAATKLLAVLPRMFAQARRLLRLRGRSAFLLVTHSGRFGLIAPGLDRARMVQRLVEHLQPLPGSGNCPDFSARFEDSRVLCVVDPTAVSPLWNSALTEGDLCVDYAFTVAAPVWRPVEFLRAIWRRRGLLVPGSRWTRRIATAYISACQCALLKGLHLESLFIASNAFVLEILRLELLQHPACTNVTEVLHGVPSVEFEQYIEEVLGHCPDARWRFRLVQKVQLPNSGIVTSLQGSGGADMSCAINVAANGWRLSDERFVSAPAERAIAEARRVFAGRRLDLIIGFNGATSHDEDFFSSSLFGTECKLIDCLILEASAAGRDVTVLYTPHPMHDISRASAQEYFARRNVIVYRDSVLSWLVADGCVALYSSSLFDALQCGAVPFTPLRVDDDVFTPTVLNACVHPIDEESIKDAVRRYMLSLPAIAGDLDERICARVQRLY